MSENLEKRIRSRSIQKHDLEVNWIKATGFIPYKGELIIYDREVDENGNTLELPTDAVYRRTTPYTYERIKIGDGINFVTDLPFVDAAVKAEIAAIKNGETFIPTLQMGQEKVGLNFIENGSWVPNPSGNYWSGWSHVEDVIELEDGSTETITTWQLKGMWITGNDYFQILISPQGIFERDLFMNTETWKREQGKWRKWATSTDLATKTSVTIGGIHQETFNADTKLDKLDNTSGLYRMPFVDNNNTVRWTYLQSTLNTATGGYPQPMVARYFKPSESWANQAAGGVLYSADPTKPYHVANKNYVDTTFVNKAGDTITGDLTITGNLQIKGISETVDAVTYKVENNLIEFNPDKTYNNTWLTGIAVNKGIKNETDLGTYGIMYDPHVDSVKLGFGTISENHTFTFNDNESAPIATREEFDDSWEEDEIFVFDKETKKFKHSGKTLSGFKKEIQDEMKSYIADYIETYMSTEIEVNDDATSLYTEGKTKEVMTEDGNLWLYVGGTNE
jgi:hypothetical protein